MKILIKFKKLIERCFKNVFSNASWEKIKNDIRPILLRTGLMPDIKRDDYSYYLKTTKNFINYIEKNKERINILKEGLDLESQKEIDNFIEKIYYISIHEILERKKIFTKTEIDEQIESIKDIARKEKLYKKFHYFEYYPSETFYGLNGLKWLPENVLKTISNGTSLDIGACYGDSSIAFYYNLGAKNIFAFEPQASNFKKLSENLSLINEPGIIPIELGISDRNAMLKISNDSYTSSIGDCGENIKVTTVDSFAKKYDVKKVSMIKIDIEGEEMKALLGSVEIIKRDMPVLSIAIYHKPEDFFEIKPWIEKNFSDYKIIVKKSNPFDPLVEVTLLAYPKNI
jgi:FkbM family methyltransferase